MNKTVCLTMVVQDQAQTIRECLQNIVNHMGIDYYVISDTGSRDHTIQLIQDFFSERNIDGEIYQDPWQDAAHNRNLALDRSLGKADYVLFLDADDRIEGDFHLPDLTADAYYLKRQEGETLYHQLALIKNTPDYLFRGLIKAKLFAPKAAVVEAVTGDYHVQKVSPPTRVAAADRTLQEADLLVAAYQREFENQSLRAHYAFQAARSYLAAGRLDRAETWYKIRLDFNQDTGERVQAHLDLGQIYLQTDRESEAVNCWLQGYDLNPKQVECLYQVISYYRQGEHYQLAHHLGLLAADIKLPTDPRLYIQPDLYRFLVEFELTITSYYVDDKRRGYEACKAVFATQSSYWQEQILRNLYFYRDYLQADSASNAQAFYYLVRGLVRTSTDPTIRQLYDYLASLGSVKEPNA